MIREMTMEKEDHKKHLCLIRQWSERHKGIRKQGTVSQKKDPRISSM